MDVTGWTIEQKMRLPDWCFGNREVTGLYRTQAGVTIGWSMGTYVLPDPACIWQLVITSMPDAGGKGYLRIGLRDTLPTTQAEMNTAIEIFPEAWRPHVGPSEIPLYSGQFAVLTFAPRRGMITESAKLVMELEHRVGGAVRVDVELVVSALPTSMAGWLEHSLV